MTTLRIGLLLVLITLTGPVAHAEDNLPSWNEGPAKQAIVDFVSRTTTAGSPEFVPIEQRIATFD